NGVEDEEEQTDRREDREEAHGLAFHGPATDAFQAALDEGPTAIVREVAERAKSGLDTPPQQSFVDRVLVVRAGKERERADGSGVGEEAHRHQEEALHHDVEEEGEYHQNAEQSDDTEARPARLRAPHHPTPEHRAQENPPRVAGGVHEE